MTRTDAPQEHMFYTEAICDEDVLLVFASSEEWLSRRQIAERLWRKVHPALNQRIERLAGEGGLVKGVEILANGREMFWYRRA